MSQTIIISNDEQDLASIPEVLQVLGIESDDPEENAQYLATGGDFWLDADKVVYRGIVLYWNWRSPYALLSFDPNDYPEHVELIRRWTEAEAETQSADQWSGYGPDFTIAPHGYGWFEFNDAEAAIAYRGGEGYGYAIWLYRGEPIPIATAPEK